MLISRGFTKRQAHHIFFVRYGESGIDVTKDPIKEAVRVILADQICEGDAQHVWPHFTSKGLDGLPQQPWSA